jgi:hypothetical protein
MTRSYWAEELTAWWVRTWPLSGHSSLSVPRSVSERIVRLSPWPHGGTQHGRSEALCPARNLRRVLPAGLDVPSAPFDVLPLALPRRLPAAVGGLELAGLLHSEASTRQRAERLDEVAGARPWVSRCDRRPTAASPERMGHMEMRCAGCGCLVDAGKVVERCGDPDCCCRDLTGSSQRKSDESPSGQASDRDPTPEG